MPVSPGCHPYGLGNTPDADAFVDHTHGELGIEAFLKQSPYEQTSLEDGYAQLAAILGVEWPPEGETTEADDGATP